MRVRGIGNVKKEDLELLAEFMGAIIAGIYAGHREATRYMQGEQNGD